MARYVVLLTLLTSVSVFATDCDTGHVRVVGGSSHLLGRVELCFNNTWGTVCVTGWDNIDAAVVCSQLGFSHSEALSSGTAFGSGSGSILLEGVNCAGSEQHLLDCPHPFPVGSTECSHIQDVGVSCQPLIFPVGVNNSFMITFRNSLEISPTVVFSNLLMTLGQAISSHCFGSESSVSNRCFENELITITGSPLRSSPFPLVRSLLQNLTSILIPSSVTFATISSADFYYLVYYQQTELVLKGGKALEIVQANPSAFTTALGIDIISSAVVFSCSLLTCLNGGTCLEGTQGQNSTCLCSQEYSGDSCQIGAPLSCTMIMPCLNNGTCVPAGSGTTATDQCRCLSGFDGDRCEIDLLFCSSISCTNGGTCVDLVGDERICLCLPGFTGTKCDINEACSTGDVRLRGGSNHLEGRVEYCANNQWGTVCSAGWDSQDSAVACAQLGFIRQDSIMTADFGGGTGPIYFSNTNCAGSERRLADCPFTSNNDCTHNQDIGVRCQPQIYQVALMNSIRASIRTNTDFSRQDAANLVITTLQHELLLAFNEYCLNSNLNRCFERDLSGRQSNVPLSLNDIQNVSAIVVPNSFQVVNSTEVTVDVYYLIYYQEREAVILDTVALNIVQVDRSLFSVESIDFAIPPKLTEPPPTQQTLPKTTPTTATAATEVMCTGETDSKWMLTYPNTPAGMTVIRPCPASTTSSSAMTSRLCTGTGEWSEVNVSACQREEFRNISNIATIVFNASKVDPAAVEALLQDLVVATMPSATNPVSQFPQDLDTTNDVMGMTVNYLRRDLESGDPTDLSTQVVDVINNVLDNNNEGGWTAFSEEQAGSERLLDNAEQYGVYFAAALANVNVSINQSDVQDNTISRDNIIVKAQIVDPNNVSDILFPEVVDVGKFGSAQSKLSRRFLLELGAESSALSTVNVIFNNLDRFLPKDGLSKATQPGTNVISTQVITFQGGEISVMKAPALNDVPAEFIFTTIEFGDDKVVNNTVCAFWDFGDESRELSRSSWSTEGVETKIIAENKSSMTFTVECKSTHLTSFAVLLDVNDALVTFGDAELLALTYVTYIGCGISICCLFLSILFFSCILRKDLFNNVHHIVHLNLCIALILAYVAFLGGVDTAVRYRIACVVVAAVLHYLFLSVFCWMLCEGIMLYLMLVVVFSSLSKRWWFFLMLGWGTPIVIVAISVGLVHEQYGTDTFCWISASDPKVGALWAFVAPMLAIILINIFFLLAALRSLFRVRRHKKKSTNGSANLLLFKELLLATVILLPLLGLTWVFGLLSINQRTSVFAWIFTVCNSLQGLCIFIFHVLRNERVCGRSRKLDKSSSVRSRSTSRQTGFTRLLRRKTDTSILYHNPTIKKANPTLNSTPGSFAQSSSFMSQESDNVAESNVLSAVLDDEEKILPAVYEEEISDNDGSVDELAGLDTKMFKTSDEKPEGGDETENDKTAESDETAKFEYTMTVNWTS